MAPVIFLFLLAHLGAAAAQAVGCPACGAAIYDHEIETVHPGEPAATLFGLRNADLCRDACASSSPDLLFYQYTAVPEGEPSCFCLATCYSIVPASKSKAAVIGSLCRDRACPKKCSNAPSPDVIYLGTPAKFIQAVYSSLSNHSSNATGNGTTTLRYLYATNSSAVLNGSITLNHNSSTNGTWAPGMTLSFEDCRAYAASSVDPPTPFFTHLEAKGSCMLYAECLGVAPAGTATAKSGSFCISTAVDNDEADASVDVV
jgi:hypothetical protein